MNNKKEQKSKSNKKKGSVQIKWNAEDYAKQSSAQQSWAIELINKIKMEGNERILDVGCGDGKITAALAEKCKNGHVVGVDSSAEMVHRSIQAYRDNHSNLSFKTMNASSLNFDEKFDIIFSNSALHWVKDHGPVLDGMYQSLKEKGHIYLRFGGQGTLDTFQPIIDSLTAKEAWASYFKEYQEKWHFYDDKTYIDWVVDTGFKPISVKLVPTIMTYKERAGLSGWIRTTWHPYLDYLPEHKKHRFIQLVVDDVVNQVGVNSNGNLIIPMMRLEVIAVKGEIK
ncbi:methyltransferase domain-containing protein [bacterium]|jgi:trans-aconitate 2-methyltransferase|nr:methyltransferase domain-containing protein [bacterium]